MKYAPYVFLYLIVCIGVCHATPSVRLNEIMASNEATIADEDGDFEDWIELYNYGDTPVDLSGWGLSDNYDDPFKWVFPPNTSIDSNEYLLVWASGKNRSNAYLHTNYSVSSAGEEVILTHPGGVRVDELTPREIPRDISVGRVTGQGDAWFFFEDPTPGAANDTTPFLGVLPPVDFSEAGGFYTNALTLTLSHADPEVTIVYTLDGSTPDISNLHGTAYQYKNRYPQNPGDPFGVFLTNYVYTHLYTDALTINDRSPQPYELAAINSAYTHSTTLPRNNPAKATVVRARAFRADYIGSRTDTHSYFIHDDTTSRYTLPVIFIAVDEPGAFSYEEGIYVAGKVFDDWRIENPDATVIGTTPANYNRRGREWERPAHFEYFTSNGTRALSQLIGLRIHGGWSRSYRLKSLRLYARRHYDTESSFDYPLFGMRRRLGSEHEYLSTFERLILRNSGNDWARTFYRDAFMQELVSHLPLATQAYQPAVHFINGEYWGLINIRERMDDRYISSHYDVPQEDIVILTGGGANVDTGYPSDSQHFVQTVQYAEANDMSLTQHYAWVRERVDTDDLALYYAVQVYLNNQDWPNNNIDYWRKRTPSYVPESPKGHDGRWRWLLYDTDFGFGLSRGNHTAESLDRVVNNDVNIAWTLVNRLFVALVHGNEEFRHTFINSLADQINTTFQPERVKALLHSFEQRINSYRAEHNDRWRLSTGPEEIMVTFAEQRPVYQRQHIRTVFGISHTVDVRLNVTNIGTGHVRINTIDITSDTPGVSYPVYPWTGIYFSTIPVTFTAQPAVGYRFVAWHVAADDGTTYTVTNSVYSQAFTTNVTVTAEYESLPFEDVPLFLPDDDGDWTDDANWTSEFYPDGVGARARIGAPTTGNRNINLRAPITVGEIMVEMTNTPYRNRIRDRDSGNTLTFACYSGVSRLVINGIGSGFFESDNEAGTHLANDLHITVNNITGNAAHGALRLRRGWSGPGGVIKDGAGVMSLTGEDKVYSGGTIISQGVLQVTAPATPVSTAFVRVNSGGQLRLTSAGDLRVYSFGGPLRLNSTGRQGVPTDEAMGVLGALRYEPDSADNHAHVMTDIEVLDVSGIHVAGVANRMTLQGALSGSGSLIKSGGGTLTLTGDSSAYAGILYISNGLVHVNNIMNTVAVSPGGALGGTGRVSDAHVESGGAISPGESIGALTIDTLIMKEGSCYDWEYSSATADSIYTETLHLPEATHSVTIRVAFVGTDITYPVSYPLFHYTEEQPSTNSVYFDMSDPSLAYVQYPTVSVDGDRLMITLVPEPMMGGLAISIILLIRRRIIAA